MKRPKENRTQRIINGIKGFFIGFIVFPIAALFITIETVFDGIVIRLIKRKVKKWKKKA